MRRPSGRSKTRKPVPKMIVSAACSVPSAATSERSRTSLTADGTTSTFGRVSAGYQSSDGQTRLQPRV